MPTPKKIAVGAIINETCSFNPVPTTLEDFKDCYFKQGAEVANVLPNERVLGGFIGALQPRHHQFEGLIACNAMPGGDLTAATYRELKEGVLAGVKQAGKLDAVFLNLMGAMVAEGEFDATGAILEELRERVGPDCFIGVSMDHHGNITAKMVAAVDVMLGYDTQPHDFVAAGRKAARVLSDIWDRGRTPQGALVKVPMLAPQDHFLTAAGPMKEWFDLAREIEQDPAVIAASPFPSQPWLDVPESGWSCLVYADDRATAQRYAERLAQKAWDLRKEFWRSGRLSVAATVAAANAEPRGLVVISDTGDSTWGGSSGDSTALIGEMLKQGLDGAALVPIIDPAALERAVQAGLGQKLTLQIGGKMSAGFSPRVAVEGTVAAIAPAGRRDFEDGISSQAGRSVLFESGNLKLVILELRDVAINHPILYEKLGLNVGQARLVVLKTGSNFQYFRKYQSRLIRADSPGLTQSDLTAFTWKHIDHPTYPFDPIEDWRS